MSALVGKWLCFVGFAVMAHAAFAMNQCPFPGLAAAAAAVAAPCALRWAILALRLMCAGSGLLLPFVCALLSSYSPSLRACIR
jgi:hypothetical protein